MVLINCNKIKICLIIYVIIYKNHKNLINVQLIMKLSHVYKKYIQGDP